MRRVVPGGLVGRRLPRRPGVRIPGDGLVEPDTAPLSAWPAGPDPGAVVRPAWRGLGVTAVTPPRCPACGISKVDFARGELASMGEHAENAREEMLGPIARGESVARPMSQPGDAADHVARLVASWAFPITVLVLIVVWVTINVTVRTFQPFPTVLLAAISAVLASLGALQGPIILRVQRRQRERDRTRDEIDHRINLRAELEIRWLDHKLTHLLEGSPTTRGQHASPQHDAATQQDARSEPPSGPPSSTGPTDGAQEG